MAFVSLANFLVLLQLSLLVGSSITGVYGGEIPGADNPPPPPVKPPPIPPPEVKPPPIPPPEVKPPTIPPPEVKPPEVKPPTIPPPEVKPPTIPPPEVKPPTIPPPEVKPPEVKPPTIPPPEVKPPEVKPPTIPPPEVKPPTIPPPEVKPPTIPPPVVKPPTIPPPVVKPPPMKKVAVQGFVYCKSCKYTGVDTIKEAAPLARAMVKLQCDMEKYRLEEYVKTDKKGFFLFKPHHDKLTASDVQKCKVFLVMSPHYKCSVPTNLNDGTVGAVLVSTPNEMSPFELFTVGPFAFEPPKKLPCYD